MDIFGEMTELHLLRSSAIPIIARLNRNKHVIALETLFLRSVIRFDLRSIV